MNQLEVELQRQYTECMNKQGKVAHLWGLPAWVDVKSLMEVCDASV